MIAFNTYLGPPNSGSPRAASLCCEPAHTASTGAAPALPQHPQPLGMAREGTTHPSILLSLNKMKKKKARKPFTLSKQQI